MTIYRRQHRSCPEYKPRSASCKDLLCPTCQTRFVSAPIWLRSGAEAMPDLSIKGVPLDELDRLRARAKRNHRSVQGELRTILSEALSTSEANAAATTTFEEALAEIRRTALRTPPESVEMIREDRD